MMNSPEEKKTKNGLGNDRLVGEGFTLFKRIVREVFMEKMTLEQKRRWPTGGEGPDCNHLGEKHSR